MADEHREGKAFPPLRGEVPTGRPPTQYNGCERANRRVSAFSDDRTTWNRARWRCKYLFWVPQKRPLFRTWTRKGKGMDRQRARRSVDLYIDGWREGDKTEILDALHERGVVIESYGPIYRGRPRVEQWVDAWFGEGNQVDRWEITSFLMADDAAVFEWRFACTWRGKPVEFEGASIAYFRDGKIWRLREYCTTAPLYEWEGAWLS
jgi:ketosteroid isomerase-like protein